MYIRRVKTRVVDDKVYYSYRLVESYRLPDGKVKQQVLLNLGTHYLFDEKDWLLLSKRIDSLLNGESLLLPMPDHIEYEAHRLANLIVKKHGKQLYCSTAACQSVYEKVDIHRVETTDVKSIGAEALAVETAKNLGLPDILIQVGFNKKQAETAMASIIGRLVKPGSEVATAEYLRSKSALDEVMDVDFSTMHKNRLYNISDLLLKNKSEIEAALYKNERNLFQFSEIVTLYDLTNTYFEGSSKENDNAAFGRSKEKRSDCVLVTLALVLDASGFPKKSHIFKGNVAEAGTLAQMMTLTTIDAIVVMDAGIATEENLQWLNKNGYKYLVISRKRNQKVPEDVSGVVVKEDKDNQITGYLIQNNDTNEAELYCHSKAMEKTANAIQDKAKQRFTDELQKIANGLSQKRCLKKYDKICEKIGRLKEKYRSVAHLYEIKMALDDEKKSVIALSWNDARKPTKEPGIYCIRTNQTELDHHQIWQTYRMLNEVEAAFRILKTDLGLRPVYHQKTDRVSGHIFITVLAYHILHTIRYQLKAKGIHDSWSTIMNTLENHYRLTTTLQREKSGVIHVRKSMRPNPDQLKIYQACNVDPIPLETVFLEY